MRSPCSPPFVGFAGRVGGDVVALVEDGAGSALLSTSARLRVE